MQEENQTPEKSEENVEQRLIVLSNDQESTEPRIIGIYGEIDEPTAAHCVQEIFKLHEKGKYLDEEENEQREPIEFIVSTEGGHVAEMFSLYDVFRRVKAEGTEVHTFGIGKVMSAGVLLLASGTKGKRRIGRHTQVMIHDISSGHSGSMREIQNDTRQIKKMRDAYIECLVEETKMTKTRLTRYFNRHIDVYLTAEEAVELGIADEIV